MGCWTDGRLVNALWQLSGHCDRGGDLLGARAGGSCPGRRVHICVPQATGPVPVSERSTARNGRNGERQVGDGGTD